MLRLLSICTIFFLVFIGAACKSARKSGKVTDIYPQTKLATDSLYSGLTPINQIEKDKTFMLDLLNRFHADDSHVTHIEETKGFDMHYIVFPLRVVVVMRPGKPQLVNQERLKRGISILNDGLKDAWIQFRVVEQKIISLNATIASLRENDYEGYYTLSQKYDLRDTCTLYLVDNEDDLCKNFSCSRTSGFANILSTYTNNVVLDKFFLDDHKVIVHEFGHYFGLYHTAEQATFGIEKVDGSNCETAGDRICDTPADPGELYSVYVNPSGCYMQGLKEKGTGLEYYPMIQNYMSYYNPCYMRPYRFSRGQLEVILNAAVKVRHNQVIGLSEFPLEK
jgi:hypothetical protein